MSENYNSSELPDPEANIKKPARGVLASQESIRGINALGAEIVSLMGSGSRGEALLAALNKLQTHLQGATKRFLEKRAYPLSESLVMVYAAQDSITQCLARPGQHFFDVFAERLEVAVSYMKSRALFADHASWTPDRMPIARQAKAAATIEIAMQCSYPERRIVYDFVALGLSQVQIAAKNEISIRRVRQVLETVADRADAIAARWLRKLQRDMPMAEGNDES